MSIVPYARRFNDHLLGRLGIILAGFLVVYWLVTRYPPIRPVIRWSFPAFLLLWGASRLYFYGVSKPLTVIAGCFLMSGGISRAAFQLVPMSEMAGAVANLIPFVGIIAEMYARYYRKHAE